MNYAKPQIAVYTYKNRTDEEAQEALKIQKQTLKQYCAENGYHNVLEYGDIGHERSGLTEMLNRIQSTNDIEKVIITRHSVLTRDLVKLAEITETIKQRGVELVSLDK